MAPKATRICWKFAKSGSCEFGVRCRYAHGETTGKLPNGSAKTARKPKRTRKTRGNKSDPISVFFAGYPEFDYKEDRGIIEEFYRMCDYFGWNRDDDERDEAHKAFKEAMVLQFNELYGTEVSKLENWHKLCVAVNIDPLPRTVKECKEEVGKVHVNLVDLVDTSGREVELFPSLRELRDYTVNNGKYFPKESAYAGGVLKFLLRDILGGHQVPSSQRRRTNF